MTTETKTTPAPRRRWLRWVGIIFGVLIVLLVVGYFLGTSAWALKTIILPKVSTAMNGKVTVADASISPFSAVTLRKLRVETKGPEPLVTAEEVRLRYSLTDIIKGNLNVSEVTLESPVVNLITFADGTSNLDPITKQPKKEHAPKEKTEKKAEKPTQLNLGKLALNNATIHKITEHKDGTKETIDLTGVNLTADQIGNDKSGKIGLAAAVKFDQGLNNASNGVVMAKVAGNFDVALDAALKPKSAKGQTKVDVSDARGSFAQVAGLGIVLNTDVTPTQLNDVSVRFSQGGKNLGALTASGPFDPEKTEGKLTVAISRIDKQVLNLAGAAMGIDFNQTTINSTNTIELTQRGRMIAVNGQLLVGTMSLTQKGETTPPMDVRAGYGLTYDQTNKTALIQSFTLNGVQQGNEFLRGTLAKPMLLEIGKGSNAVDESAFDLAITNFNLPDWKAFLGTNATVTSGKLGLTLNLVSQQAGKKLSLKLATRLIGLTAAAGSNRIENADVALDARGVVQDFSAVNLEQYRMELARGGQSALSAAGALQYNTKSQDADVQTVLDVSLPQVASLVSVPGLTISAGDVKFTGHVVQKNTTPQQTNNPVIDRTVTGKLTLDSFTGAFGSNHFDRFMTAADLDVAMHGTAIDIKKCSGTLQQGGQAGGAFDVVGNYNTGTKAAQITAKITDLNQNTLKSFLASALGEKKLETIAINATATAKLDSATDGTVKAELHVANLVVNDPSGAVPRTPLALDANADVAMAKQVIDLRSVQLALTKTDRAPNSLNVAGHFDLTKSNAYTGNVKVSSDGLDLTHYYEIFAKKKDTNAATQSTGRRTETVKADGEAKPQTEPAPIKLPFAQFTEEVNIAKVFLREVAISNLVSKTTIDNGRVNLNPFSLTLNGAGVTATAALNLSVPGFEYDLSAKMDKVPVEPLVNTFAPEKKGQMKGDLLANAQIKGAGVTGASFKKNLQGNLAMTLTNANVQVTQYKRLHQILVPIAAALQIPQLSESPLTWVDAHATIGNGAVNLQDAMAESSVFRAGLATGTITIADVLTNSVLNKLPVDIALRRNIADVAHLTPAGTAADVQFIPLPRFVSVGGTLGNPKTEIDKVSVGRALVSKVGQYVGGDAGKLLKGLGNLGGGNGGTNQAATNTTKSLIQGLGGLLQKPANDGAATNAAGTNAPAKKKRGGFNLNDILK